MPVERSAGIVIFRNTPRERKYLVIRSARKASKISPTRAVKEFWDFPKGVLEKGETGVEAALREAREEVGVEDLKLVPGFKETVRYFTRRDGKSIPKFVAMFLAETSQESIKLSWEHDKYEWLYYQEAHKKVTLRPMKNALRAAENFLNTSNVKVT